MMMQEQQQQQQQLSGSSPRSSFVIGLLIGGLLFLALHMEDQVYQMFGATPGCDTVAGMLGGMFGGLPQIELSVDDDYIPPAVLPWEEELYDVPSPDMKVAICAIIKDSETFIDEWIDYNFAVGFHAIYIYDNTPRNDFREWGQKQYEAGRNLQVIHFPEENNNLTQKNAYNGCAHRFKNESDYIAFIDDDEFLVLKKHRDISELIAEHLPDGGALTISWRRFGSSNKTQYSTVPTTRRFMYRELRTHIRVKSIVKSEDFIEMQSAHSVFVKNNKTIQDTTGGGDYDWDGAYNRNRPDDVAVFNHYKFKSDKEWWYKECVRQTVLGAGMSWQGCGEPPKVGVTYDDAAWKILRARVPKYRVFDEWHDRS
uniref:Glycosyltransferase family 92 protein n=1 Tax=Grammatophora oceanica TaxID=210454 RepID=A0A7S1Y0U1_9STRA